MTLDEVSQVTKIKKEFLEAIEKGEYSLLPSSAYAYGFVRNYAKFLGLNEEQSIALFKREFDEEKVFEVLPKNFSRNDDIALLRFRIGRNFLFIFILLAFILLFIFLQFKDAIFTPPLNIDTPKEGSTVYAPDLAVKGSTDSNSVVYVEGQLVSVDSDGNFHKTISIFPGKNIIEIKSINRFGKQREIQRHINVKSGY